MLKELEKPDLINKIHDLQKQLKKANKEIKTEKDKKAKKELEKVEKDKKEEEEAPKKLEGKLPDLVGTITDIVLRIRRAHPYGGNESHYQASLEMDLREEGLVVSHEMACLLHYKTSSGRTRQLPHDIRSREDLLLPDEQFVLELKAISKLSDKDFKQLIRYMNERCVNSDWGDKTKGLLINFGETDVEIWYIFFAGAEGCGTPVRVQVLQQSIAPLSDCCELRTL